MREAQKRRRNRNNAGTITPYSSDRERSTSTQLKFPLKTDFTHASLNITAFYIDSKYADLKSEESIGMNKAKNVGVATINLTPHSPYLLANKTITIEEHFVKKRKVKFEELTLNLEGDKISTSRNLRVATVKECL